MPELHRLDYGTPAFCAQEELGLSVVKDAAFVLVAGGLGERLGYTDIKLSLPVQSLTEQCYLELYVAQILTMQAKAGCAPLPLAIMTSDDTHARTVALLAQHANFGAAPGQITLIKQEKVPALLDNLAHFALEEGDPYTLETKPHGHGDVHTLLASSGLAEAWAAAGRRHIVFFQDTNALCFTVTIAALGISASAGLDMNSIAVPRKAKDAVGAITKLVRPDGSSLTVNVEYNQLEPMLKSSGYPEGDVNGADGFSPFPGNINQLIFAIPAYVDVLKRTGGLVPEFVNPKYADASKTRFKKPTRLECMMQVRAGAQRGGRERWLVLWGTLA
jgi:UDP-sugar pyrophosphorylase